MERCETCQHWQRNEHETGSEFGLGRCKAAPMFWDATEWDAAVRFAPSSAHWSKELRRLFGDDARTGIEVLESRHRQELARAARLEEALQRLMDR